jgi:hypothetical protein
MSLIARAPKSAMIWKKSRPVSQRLLSEMRRVGIASLQELVKKGKAPAS